MRQEEEDNYLRQITRLLADRSMDNCPLILDLISGIGVSKPLLSYVFGIAVFHPDRHISARAFALLDRYASEQTAQKARRVRQSAAYFYEEAEFIGRYKGDEVDLFHLLLAEKMCLWHRYRPEPSSNAEMAFQTLDLRRLPHKQLSAAIVDMDFLTFLALPAHRDFDVAHALPFLVQMPRLETIILENVCLDRFPVELFALPRLKTLVLRKGKLRPRAPVQVPEGGSHGSASLERLVCEGYPIVGEDDLGPFPQLREAILPRCGLSTLDFLAQSSRLEQLDASNNRLQHLPAFLARFVHLRTLNLSQNPFRSLTLDLGELTQLEHLEVSLRRGSVLSAYQVKPG
jgi:hypothetical protein